MKLQQEMYSEVRKWKSSGQSRADFVKVKTYTLAKFDYWIRRYKKEKIKPTKSSFKEIIVLEDNQLLCVLTNQPKKISAKENILQSSTSNPHV